jgi:glycerol-3-phosphate dehydrogenase (NAD(P)+)
MKIAVLGAGAWGTAIAIVLAARHEVRLWARDAMLAAALRAERANRRYLPGCTLPAAVEPTADLGHALDAAGLMVAAVATAGLRETLRAVRASGRVVPVVWLCKGFEAGSGRLPHQVCAEELAPDVPRAVLSGPSFAEEVTRGLPAALVLASTDAAFARDAARTLHGTPLRIYPSQDVVGVEAAGAIKNVMAIAAGVSDGLELGLSARAALITRGLAEMTRLGIALGGRAETFMGLAGAGDLVLTCTGDLSRNRRVGLALARGEALADVLARLGHTAEGVMTARAVAAQAHRLDIDMPITRAVCRVLDDPREARAAVQELLAREQRSEY